MILRLRRRYVVIVPSGVAMMKLTIKTKKEQLLWQALIRAETCTLVLEKNYANSTQTAIQKV